MGTSVTRVRMIQRGSVAGCRVGGRDDGGAVRSDGAVDVGALFDRREVSDLERLGNRLSVVCAHASDGGCIGALRGNLKKLKGGAVGGTTREVRLVSDAKGMSAQARDVSRAIGSQPFPSPDGEGGFGAVDRASRPPDMNARQRRPLRCTLAVVRSVIVERSSFAWHRIGKSAVAQPLVYAA